MSGLKLSAAELAAHLPELRTGDRVLLSGAIYTARDAAHKRLFELLDAGKPLPFALKGAVIYYAGPTPGQQGMAVGACGPTTAGRMDGFAPRQGRAEPGRCGRHRPKQSLLFRRRRRRGGAHRPVH